MTDAGGLTDFQIAVARMFFELDESVGFVVAGGAALVASELTTRPTRDLDLFAGGPVKSVTAAKEALTTAAAANGWLASVVDDSPTFCRLVIRGPEELLVDLALDSPPASTPIITVLGPTLAPLELAGRKMLALFGRAEARDFADVYVLAQRFGREALIFEAASADPGFNITVLAQMMTTLNRFSDRELPVTDGDASMVRTFFSQWADELQ